MKADEKCDKLIKFHEKEALSFTAWRHATAVYAVIVCLSVRLSVRHTHKSIFY